MTSATPVATAVGPEVAADGGPPVSLRGMTWDHPRGYLALETLSGADGSVPVRWDRQPLAGFEARPVRELAGQYDLIVIDHPGLGESVRDEVLLPLETLLDRTELDHWRSTTIGGSFDSYLLSDHQWAVPIDAAAQVGVLAAALRISVPGPDLWTDAVSLARRVPTTLCLGGPHALLMYQAICAAFDATGGAWLDRSTGTAAVELMGELLDVSDRDLSTGDPIAVLDAMAAGRAAYCPLVYGYVTYQRAATPAAQPLCAVDAPAATPGGRRGSVLGGTGVAVSANCARPTGAADLIRLLLQPRVQGAFFADHGGQGATDACWSDPVVDDAAAGFYSSTAQTLRDAWVRPRFDGYIPFQRDGSAAIREGLLAGTPAGTIVDRLRQRYREAAGR